MNASTIFVVFLLVLVIVAFGWIVTVSRSGKSNEKKV